MQTPARAREREREREHTLYTHTDALLSLLCLSHSLTLSHFKRALECQIMPPLIQTRSEPTRHLFTRRLSPTNQPSSSYCVSPISWQSVRPLAARERFPPRPSPPINFASERVEGHRRARCSKPRYCANWRWLCVVGSLIDGNKDAVFQIMVVVNVLWLCAFCF
jgi:hypothetical protein